MDAGNITKTLRWLARETEFVFAAEQLREAAALIESLQGKIVGKDALIATNKALMNAAISENRRLQGELAATLHEAFCNGMIYMIQATREDWSGAMKESDYLDWLQQPAETEGTE